MRARRFALSAAVSLTAALTLLAGPAATPASGDPLDGARERLAQIEEEQSAIGERWAEAKVRLSEGRAKAAVLDRDIAGQQAKVDALQAQATQIALTRFQSAGVDSTLRLLTAPDPDDFLDQLSTVNKLEANMNSLLQDFQAQQANLADLRRSADTEVAGLVAEERRLAELDTEIQAKIHEGEQLVARLSAEQRRRLEAEQGNSRDTGRKQLVEVGDDGSANARALAAVRYAVSKVPNGQYVWGAEGPNSFDCSGLMIAAYRTVGVSLPHSSRAQFGVGRAVSRSQLRPGDLVFFYSPIHHVGMYMGKGLFVHARNPRNDLEITRLSSYPAYQGARRVIG